MREAALVATVANATAPEVEAPAAKSGWMAFGSSLTPGVQNRSWPVFLSFVGSKMSFF
jgi:hypothetical protein